MLGRYWLMISIFGVALALVLGAWFYLGIAGGSGTLGVKVHDAPCDSCTHVWVTFTSASVHESDMSSSGWTTLNTSGTTVDLMALNGTAAAQLIGVSSLKAGHYEQVRLNVSRVVVQLSNGLNLTASVVNASGAVVTGSFDVHSGMTTTISIDVDLASSLHITGNGVSLGAVFTPHLGSVVTVS